MTKGSLFVLIGMISLLQINFLQAQPLALEQQAQNHIRLQLTPRLQTGAELDIRIRPQNAKNSLSRCAKPATFTSNRPLKSGSFTLKAHCDYPRRWTRHLHGQISIRYPALVSIRPLSKGHPLTPQDLKLVAIDEKQLQHGFYQQESDVIGHKLKRSLAANKPIHPRLLSAPMLVNKGDEVIIEAGNSSFRIEVTGTALQGGHYDQQISVENKRSGKVIRARITAKGRVKANH